MQSNSKIDSHQKQYLKSIKAEMPDVKLANNGETTIAYKPRGNTVEFALSVMSPDEKKFRRKVGEYYAMCYFENGQTVKMATSDFVNMMYFVFDTTVGYI